MPRDTAHAAALAVSVGVCHKGGVRRLRDFASIAHFFSDREIDELQAVIDVRHQAQAVRPDEPPEARPSRRGPMTDEPGLDPRGAVGV